MSKRDLYHFDTPVFLDGKHVFDFECDLDCIIDDDQGTADPYLWVERIWIDGKRVPLLDPGMWGEIGRYIKAAAQADTDLFETVAKDQGVTPPASDRAQHGTYVTSTGARAA